MLHRVWYPARTVANQGCGEVWACSRSSATVFDNCARTPLLARVLLRWTAWIEIREKLVDIIETSAIEEWLGWEGWAEIKMFAILRQCRWICATTKNKTWMLLLKTGVLQACLGPVIFFTWSQCPHLGSVGPCWYVFLSAWANAINTSITKPTGATCYALTLVSSAVSRAVGRIKLLVFRNKVGDIQTQRAQPHCTQPHSHGQIYN